MRSILTILLISLSLTAPAQKINPAGVANTYMLTNTDGYPGNNYMDWVQAPSGKVYAKDFFGTLHITGNNFIHYIAGVKNIGNSTNLTLQSNGELWLSETPDRISVVKDDSLWRTFIFKSKNQYIYLNAGNQLFILERKGEEFVLYEFRNHEWVALKKFPIPQDLKDKEIVPALNKNGELTLTFQQTNKSWKIYELDTSNARINFVTTISHLKDSFYSPYFYNPQWQEDTSLEKDLAKFIAKRTGIFQPLTPELFHHYFQSEEKPDTSFLYKYGNGIYEYLSVDSNRINSHTTIFETKDKINNVVVNPSYPYLTVLTDNAPFRVFPWIKKYPYIYDHNNSYNIFTLAQDDMGRIWAGNYQNNLSLIDPQNLSAPVHQLKKQPYQFMNVSLNYKGKIYLAGEIPGGLLQYDMNGNMRRISPDIVTGYYLYLARRGQKVYFGSFGPEMAVYYCDVNDLDNPVIYWQKLDTAEGIQPFAMISFTEDTLGRIWMGNPKKGFAVYNPKENKAISYSTQQGQTRIGFISCLTDKRGTVWMGSDNHGLWYYNDYTKPPTPQNVHQLSHPLLNNVKRITSMAIYKDWLVMGCYNRVCLLNLDSFYLKKKIIVRYLNPQEAAFTSTTEQNTMLVSKTDSTLWFSTSDMLYQWDIHTWLHLPVYKANVKTFINFNNTREEMNTSGKLRLSAYTHGFDIFFEYLTPDGLPRFTRTALVGGGDSIIYTQPGMQSKFSYMNLNSGTYSFYIQIFEQDGTTSTYRYVFIINKFVWQHWWFWLLVCLLFFTPFIFWLNASREKALQERKMSQLNVVTMSGQFRPHFILNALNAIGADLKDKPNAESIISRLGESINLIFNYAQQKKVEHYLEDEWILVKNVIEINRAIYLPDLEVEFTGWELLDTYKNTAVPMGILEIHVENALLHGLRNKPTPPYKLSIALTAGKDNLYVEIADNGIGRQRAMSISSYRSHGTGTKNLMNVLNILNKYNKHKIETAYIDLPQEKDSGGTVVKIKIPLDYKYRY